MPIQLGPAPPGERVRRLLLASGVVIGVLCQSSCSGADGRTPADSAGRLTTPTAAVRPTVAPSSAIPTIGPLADGPERARILADYKRFWRVTTTVSQQPPTSWRRTLATVAVEPLLSEMLDLLTEQHRKGLIDYGTITVNPRIVRTAGRKVSIIDCQDASKSGTLDIDTGVPKTVGSARTPFAGVLTVGKDGRWRLSEARLLPGTC